MLVLQGPDGHALLELQENPAEAPDTDQVALGDKVWQVQELPVGDGHAVVCPAVGQEVPRIEHDALLHTHEFAASE